jgi:glycine/D-amino acid oxidase-like deaminating enzyme
MVRIAGMSGQSVRVAIVGSGFSGLGMAVRLKQEGIDDFVVLERAGDVGGTWRENTYVVDALKTMDERDVATVEVRPEVQRAFVRDVAERMEGTVWMSGCASWYIDATGRNSTLWPDFTWRFRQRTRRFEPTDYVLRARSEAPAAPVPA